MTNWKIILTGVKVLSSTSGFLAWGSGNGRGAPRKAGFQGQQGLITGILQDCGKQELYSWRVHNRSSAQQDPRKNTGDLIRTWARSACYYQRVSSRGGGAGSGSLQGQRLWQL